MSFLSFYYNSVITDDFYSLAVQSSSNIANNDTISVNNSEINIDVSSGNSLSYGASYQTNQTFHTTVEPIVNLVQEAVTNPQNFIVDSRYQFAPQNKHLNTLESNNVLTERLKSYVNNELE